MDFDLMVGDDGSTDGTREILRAAERDARIRVIKHDRKRKMKAVVQTALGEAHGESFCIFDAELGYDLAT